MKIAQSGPDRLLIQDAQSITGTIAVPGDKSISHRALLLAGLANGSSVLRGLSNGEDVNRTRAAIEAVGVRIDGEQITGGDLHEPERVINVGNSGTGMRLLAGWCAGHPWLSVLEGDESISKRPMDRVVIPLTRMGAKIDGRQGGRFSPLVIRGGTLQGIDYELEVPSAQVKGAVLLAGLLAEGKTVVRESVISRMHTEELMSLAGIDVHVQPGSQPGAQIITVHPSMPKPFTLDVPGDPSQAAFWVVAACIAPESELIVERVYIGPARAAFLEVLERMGADIDIRDCGRNIADIRARSSNLYATSVSGGEVAGLIDEIPVLALASVFAQGETVFSDASELRVKESDRVKTTVAMLQALGASADERPDGLVVHGIGPRALRGGTVDSQGDHRIAMCAAIAALRSSGSITIDGWASVATSYPGFAEEFQRCVS